MTEEATTFLPNLRDLLIVLAAVVASLVIASVWLRPKGRWQQIAGVVVSLAAFVCLRDMVVHRSLCRRGAIIRTEIRTGFPVEEIAGYLKANEKRLQIREWRHWDKDGRVWYTISFHDASCVLAVLRGHGGLVIRLDPENETVREVAWFL